MKTTTKTGLTFQEEWIIIIATVQDTWKIIEIFQSIEILLGFGIIVSDIASDKADRKERLMEQEEEKTNGRYLSRRCRGRRFRKYLAVLVLPIWDGLLLYMIVDCLIEPVYGAAFVAVISVYLGYQI